MKSISKYFLNGLIIIVPIAITIFVVAQIFSFAENILGRHLPQSIHFPGIGLLAVVILLVLTGWLSSHWLLKELLQWGERLAGSIPVVKFIYNSVKKISTALFESQQLLKNAVLVPYPHQGVKALGFLMPELSVPLAQHFNEEHVCVFVPLSLNMTAGVNILVAKQDVIALDVTSESALQYVLTAGAIMPDTGKATNI
ncbi:MAG: hypothetical protein K0Q77_2093 [Anaerosporomusa subterranea]|jgi:uncharacterized membrane protein|nr:hypothetical protein [Anaerosporomusa subterranea]